MIYGFAGGRATIDTSSFGCDAITIMPFSNIAWTGTPEHGSTSGKVILETARRSPTTPAHSNPMLVDLTRTLDPDDCDRLPDDVKRSADMLVPRVDHHPDHRGVLFG